MKHLWLFALAAILGPVLASAQVKPPWTVVRLPSDETFSLKLVSPLPPASCDKCDAANAPAGPNAPTGQAKITRDAEHVTIEVDIRSLPAEPGRYYLYIVNHKGGAKKVAELGTAYKDTLELPAAEHLTFMLLVSDRDRLTRIPQSNRILLYSTPPKGLRPVPRP